VLPSASGRENGGASAMTSSDEEKYEKDTTIPIEINTKRNKLI
jgi:hypothetical protein